MSTLHYPPVTLEDLQAFQAKHFPTQQTATLTQHPHDHPEETEEYYDRSYDYDYDYEYENEEDDLGYYPDGVKRTLTDEQIKIFRHSEIHALRREKELREEELAERTAHEDEKNVKMGQEYSGQEGVVSEQAGLQQSQADKAEGVGVGAEASSTSTSLDYDDAGHGSQAQGRASGAPFAGRKIISYDD